MPFDFQTFAAPAINQVNPEPMRKLQPVFLVLLILLNAIVLLGQLWPEGAPPFASTVNVVTLILNLAVFIVLLARKNRM